MPDARLETKSLRVCETCPWLIKNHGKRKPVGWYSKRNLRRLWTGLRTGDAPGMICHSTDPDADGYGGHANIKPGRTSECGGAITLILMNMNAIAEGKPQPIQSPLRRNVIARFVERFLIGQAPEVEDRSSEIGVPWTGPL